MAVVGRDRCQHIARMQYQARAAHSLWHLQLGEQSKLHELELL